ncbi:MAG: hypothetical protein ACR2QO_09510, partial [Acidimicrobiales bacterium]
MTSRRTGPAHSPRPRWLAVIVPIAIAAVVVASCGGSEGSATDETAPVGDATTAPTPGDGDSASDDSATDDSAADDSATDDSATDDSPTDDSATDNSASDDVEPVVYNDDFASSIQPIFADRCASCHSPGGPGTAHWTLATAGDIVANHEDIAVLLASRAMPPWPAGGESPAFREDRSLRDDQLQAILDWSAAGAPLDVDADSEIRPVVPVVGLTDPDRTVTAAAPYAGSTAVTDDYRCQIFDPELPDGGWITSYEFIPDAKAVVHHAIGYLVPASAREAAASLDGADGKPGWECYGSSGLGNDDIFLGWAPGQLPSELPAGTGLWVEPGSFIVVQVHYHYETEAPPDRSALALVTDDPNSDLEPVTVSEYIAPAEIPCSTNEAGPLCDRDAALAAAVERYGPEGVLADGLLRLCGQTVDDFANMTDGIASASCDIPAAFVGGTGEIIS